MDTVDIVMNTVYTYPRSCFHSFWCIPRNKLAEPYINSVCPFSLRCLWWQLPFFYRNNSRQHHSGGAENIPTNFLGQVLSPDAKFLFRNYVMLLNWKRSLCSLFCLSGTLHILFPLADL